MRHVEATWLRNSLAVLACVFSPVAASLTSCDVASAGKAERVQETGRTVLYVDAGSLGGECSDARPVAKVSPAAPWCSLDRALEAAPDDSVVLVRAGTYSAAEVRRRLRSEFVTFRPFEGEKVTLEGLSIEDSSYLRLEGFTIRGRTRIQFGSRIQLVGNDIAKEGITMRPSDRVLIEGNVIHDLTYEGDVAGAGYGVWLIGGWNDPARPQKLTNVTIRGNRFSRIPADGIQASQVENLLIEDNEFDHIAPFLRADEHSDGIQLHGEATNVTIRRNFFHDQPGALIAKRSVFRNLVIENNLMVRLDAIALNIYDAPGARIVNNTIWDTAVALSFRDLPEVAVEMKGATVANNILEKLLFEPGHVAVEDYNLIGTRQPATPYGPNDMFGEPGFVSPLALDYRLGRGSRAIDSGASQYAPSRDREGQHRIDIRGRRNRGAGSRPYIDRGALEYASGQRNSSGPVLAVGDVVGAFRRYAVHLFG
jgi:hypothetical protein